MKLIIILLRFFTKTEKTSMQNRVLRAKKEGSSEFEALRDTYLQISTLVEKVKYGYGKLNFSEALLLAKHYKTFKNELNGKSVKYEL